MSMPKVTIRNVHEDELVKLQTLTEEEGWNSSFDYHLLTHRSCPSGFFGAFTDEGDLISACGGIKMTNDLGFISVYITNQKYRGMGFGKPVFDRCISFLGDINICLNAAQGKENIYAKSGFKFKPFLLDTYWSSVTKPENFTRDPSIIIQDSSTIDMEVIEEYDKQVYPGRPVGFLRDWYNISYQAFHVYKDGSIAGYAFLQKGVTGVRIMPMYADTLHIAEHLMARIADTLPDGTMVEVTAPRTNSSAGALFKSFMMKYFAYGTRMFTKKEIILDPSKVYGVTNYENMLM